MKTTNLSVNSTQQPEMTSSLYKIEDSAVVSMNTVFQSIVDTKRQRLQEQNISLRRDELPIVKGDEKMYHKLYDHLFNMVIDHPFTKNNFFIYIKSSVLTPEIMHIALEEGDKNYIISFYTNVIADENWYAINEEKLNECSKIAKELNAEFNWKNYSNTGCLFTLTLVGRSS